MKYDYNNPEQPTYHERKPSAPTEAEKLDGFIYQTSQDYDLPYDTVKEVLQQCGKDRLYMELEIILKENAQRNEDPNTPKTKTIKEMESALRSVNFFIGNLTDLGIKHYYTKLVKSGRIKEQ